METVTRTQTKHRFATPTAAERAFLTYWHQLGGPELAREWLFHPTRNWRFDFAAPDVKIAIEIDGGVRKRGGGRHNRPDGFENDLEKVNAAIILDWRVFRFTPKMLQDDAFGHLTPVLGLIKLERANA